MSGAKKSPAAKRHGKQPKQGVEPAMDAIEVEVFRHLFESAAEEMGVVLQRTASSPNIKERLDFSCALVDAEGAMIAQAAHIPVHLGSCHLTARRVFERVELEPGDVVVLNDPYLGGTHLPDITMIAPVFLGSGSKPDFAVVSRAHHADVGGGVPGSMGNFDEIYKEGLIIPPVKIERRGERVQDVENLILANVRTPEERRGDLGAQIASVKRGGRRLEALADEYGRETLRLAGRTLRERSERAMRGVIAALPNGTARASDRLDGLDTPRIAVAIEIAGDRLRVDFRGSGPAVAYALNAHEAITLSCVFYVLRCLADESIPTNSGLLAPVEVLIPDGTVVGAQHPSAVAGGNVETSQRIVDVLMAAFAGILPSRIPAASQGSMNNLSLGGMDGAGQPFTYFETIAGGVGASAEGPGASGLHSHMTNTLNTPIEAIELALPVRVTAYHLREDSGGAGRHRGGEGVVREIEALLPLSLSWLATRRESSAPGRARGESGLAGQDFVVSDGKAQAAAPRAQFKLEPGQRFRIETPGGGGYGRASKS